MKTNFKNFMIDLKDTEGILEMIFGEDTILETGEIKVLKRIERQLKDGMELTEYMRDRLNEISEKGVEIWYSNHEISKKDANRIQGNVSKAILSYLKS